MVSIPSYVTKELHKFQHPTPRCAQYSPYQWTHPNYGATKKLSTPLDTSLPIPEEKNHRIQQILGTFLCYARDVDCNMLPSLNTTEEQQSNPTKNNESVITKFIDYAATNPSAIIQYKSGKITIHIDSDASYLSEPQERNHTGGHYYLSLLPAYPEKSPNPLPQANGPTHMECRILKHVLASAD